MREGGVGMKHIILRCLKEKQDGIGVIEIILILVVLIGLVVIFREALGIIVSNVFEEITSLSDTFISE